MFSFFKSSLLKNNSVGREKKHSYSSLIGVTSRFMRLGKSYLNFN